MKKMKWFFAALLGIIFASFSTLSLSEETKRVWLGSACYKLNLEVTDKLMNGSYLAKYVLKSEDGRVFVSERNGDDDSNTARVTFPDDFHEEKLFQGKKINLEAGHCSIGSYTWYIYANGILFDTGTIAFKSKGVDR